MSKLNLAKIIGDPKRLDRELQLFRKDNELLSSDKTDWMTQYSKRWVAIYDGQVRADALTLKQLLVQVDELKLRRQDLAIRFIDKNQRRMIL